MLSDPPPHSTIQHGPHFFELIFTDFRPTTVERWLNGFEWHYPLLRQAPWVRILCDLREIHALSPYALKAFEKGIACAYKTLDVRIAFLVEQSPVDSAVGHELVDVHLQLSSAEYVGYHPETRGNARLFRRREPAFDWLREGVPLAIEGDLTDRRADVKTEA